MSEFDRRTALRGGVVAAAGAIGVVASSSAASASSPAARTLTLTLANHQSGVHGKRRSERPERGDSVLAGADIHDSVGRHIGRLESTGTSTGRHTSSPARSVLTQVLSMGEDSIIGTGSGDARGLLGDFAVVGGTGRYAGARGSYTITDTHHGARVVRLTLI
jgi:hypothetical protein